MLGWAVWLWLGVWLDVEQALRETNHVCYAPRRDSNLSASAVYALLLGASMVPRHLGAPHQQA